MVQKNESLFVGTLEEIIKEYLLEFFPELHIRRGAVLDYQSGFKSVSKFQTDLCIYEDDTPRVVLELKTSPTTHDVMVYSQKADDHKRIFPHIVYGMVAERGSAVATKLLKHNRHMDFALYLGELSKDQIAKTMSVWIKLYVEESMLRQEVSNGDVSTRGFFRKTICQ
jgi:hypothetical protein